MISISVKKIKEDLELHKPFKVIYDGEDFGIYKYNPNKNWYEGVIGHIPMDKMLQAIVDQNYFIKLESVE